MIHLRRALGVSALFAIVTIGSAVAEPVLPTAARPEEVGLSSSQLARIDPREQLIAIYMVQVNDGDRIMLRNRFRAMVQSAIIN